jgi:hypothetical protein
MNTHNIQLLFNFIGVREINDEYIIENTIINNWK